MHLGLGSYTYTWAAGVPGHTPAHPLTALGLLEKAVALGVKVVQFCDNLPLTRLNPPDLAEFEDFAKKHGLIIEIGTRGIGSDNLLAHLALARRFQSPFVRVVVDAKGDEPTPDEVIARWRPLLRRYAAAGVKLAIENHDRFSAKTLVNIIETLGPAHVGICLDTANSLGALEGPEVVVATLAPYVLNLHVKDFIIQRVSSQMGFTVAGCAVGQGRLDVPWLLEQLRAAGKEVNAIIELWTPLGASLAETIQHEAAWAAESVRYLRKFIPD